MLFHFYIIKYNISHYFEMNYRSVSIGIVTFKSEKVILDCLKSIKKIKNIIIFDNSNDINLKYKIKKKIS